jgi:hypothetical protein
MRNPYFDILLTAVLAIPAFFLIFLYGKDKEPESPPWEVPKVTEDWGEFNRILKEYRPAYVPTEEDKKNPRSLYYEYPPDPTFDNGIKDVTNEIYNVKKEKGKYKWTEEQIHAIQSMSKRGTSTKDIANFFYSSHGKVSPKAIKRVLTTIYI